MTTIPSTPAKGKTLPVRRVGISREKIEQLAGHPSGAYDVTYCFDAGDRAYRTLPGFDTYTLLPPHLAEQWEELRKAKAEAERRLREAMNVKARFMDAAYLQWCESTDALAAFERQHGIGGGA